MFACNKENETLGEAPKKDYATLKVLVELGTHTGTVPLPNANIYLFDEAVYQAEGTHVIFSAATDALGRANFYTLEKPQYYITVVAPDGRRQEFLEDFPARSVTNLPVFFPKE